MLVIIQCFLKTNVHQLHDTVLAKKKKTTSRQAPVYVKACKKSLKLKSEKQLTRCHRICIFCDMRLPLRIRVTKKIFGMGNSIITVKLVCLSGALVFSFTLVDENLILGWKIRNSVFKLFVQGYLSLFAEGINQI